MSSSSGKLFVLGRTRVGKGEIIKTAVQSLTGSELKITSDRLDSHTRRSAAYSVTLNGKKVELTDTVGYEDTRGDDTSEAAFLQLLGRTGSSPYYPPLVVLQALGGSDMAWLKKISSVFPSIVCAVRCKTKAFEAAKASFAQSEFKPLQLFHLHEYLDEEDDEGKSRSMYEQDVMRIVEYYSALFPFRQKLNYDTTIFQGMIERVKIRTETKTEDTFEDVVDVKKEDAVVKTQKIVTVNAGGHYVQREVRRGGTERLVAGMKTLHILGAGGWDKMRTVNEWVKDTRDCVVEQSSIQQINVNFIKKMTIRSFYERGVYEVWKVLSSGIKIFMHYEEGKWEKVCEKVVATAVTERYL